MQTYTHSLTRGNGRVSEGRRPIADDGRRSDTGAFSLVQITIKVVVVVSVRVGAPFEAGYRAPSYLAS